ncbi:MAG: hypothetical protein R6X02_09800 [Enhygromyxa sp.]
MKDSTSAAMQRPADLLDCGSRRLRDAEGFPERIRRQACAHGHERATARQMW